MYIVTVTVETNRPETAEQVADVIRNLFRLTTIPINATVNQE